MTTILEILAIIAITIGTAFTVIGVIGFHRLPDVYTRLHATGKVGVFGVVLLLSATALVTSGAWSKVLVLIALLLIVGPVTAHALSSAAYRLGVPMQSPHRDDLQAMMHQDGRSTE
ncbi:MAG: monovalent cation/H(+) antiporter subunit G [Anaerolineae bacterium]|nr:monovalent cation/H(+) antiporter subunit G [Anaerolineae bacterium]MCO5206010.1 monovalent cation/H(+) antiporter subunit G [Anaerolineae bacterium]